MFKPGDLVIRTGCDSTDVKKGSIYEVEKVLSRTITLKGIKSKYCIDYFKLVNNPTKNELKSTNSQQTKGEESKMSLYTIAVRSVAPATTNTPEKVDIMVQPTGIEAQSPNEAAFLLGIKCAKEVEKALTSNPYTKFVIEVRQGV